MFRYTLHIYFKATIKNIKQPFKTLKEANNYVDIVDDTCLRAYIVDEVNGEIALNIK